MSLQVAWAENLNFSGSNAWALPSIDQASAFFVAFGNPISVPEFSNVQIGSYWSGTEFSPGFAWNFSTLFGCCSWDNESGPLFAVAVRPADVATEVPEPQSLALVLLALGAGAVVRRKWPH